MSVEITQIKVGGQDTPVFVDRRGSFSIKVANYTVHGDTLEEVTKAARRMASKAKIKVEIPFRTRDGKHGVATTIDTLSRKIHVRIGNRAHQLDNYAREFRADTPDSVFDRLKEIRRISNELHSEERKLVDGYELRLVDAIQEEVDRIQAAREAQAGGDEHVA